MGIFYMTQETQTGALYQSRSRMERKWEGGSKEWVHMYTEG